MTHRCKLVPGELFKYVGLVRAGRPVHLQSGLPRIQEVWARVLLSIGCCIGREPAVMLQVLLLSDNNCQGHRQSYMEL